MRIQFLLLMAAVLGVAACTRGGPPPTQPPTAPANVQAIAGDGSVTLSWDLVPNATAYNVYVSSQPGVTKDNYAAKPDGMKHPDVTPPAVISALANGVTYYFVVTAVNQFGESPESREVSATPVAQGLVIASDRTVPAGSILDASNLTILRGVTLSSPGDLTIRVERVLFLEGKIRVGGRLTMILGQGSRSGPEAEVEAQGPIQITSTTEDLLSDEQVEQEVQDWHDQLQRGIGQSGASSSATPGPANTAGRSLGAAVAWASVGSQGFSQQEGTYNLPCLKGEWSRVRLPGILILGNPQQPCGFAIQTRSLVFAARIIRLRGTITIAKGPSPDGDSATAVGCPGVAKGKPGKHSSVIFLAHSFDIEELESLAISVGKAGDGGNADADGNAPPPAIPCGTCDPPQVAQGREGCNTEAVGGRGGDAVIAFIDIDTIPEPPPAITGVFDLGDGGKGGDASAGVVAPNPPQEKGQDVGPPPGANPGRGLGRGGNGGRAFAQGGDGGNRLLVSGDLRLVPGGDWRNLQDRWVQLAPLPSTSVGKAGNGGSATAVGGAGGDCVNCWCWKGQLPAPAGFGGNGGDATAKPGKGGKNVAAAGTDGINGVGIANGGAGGQGNAADGNPGAGSVIGP